MVDTIASVVDGGRKRLLAGLTHILGATLAAAALGSALGTLGLVVGAPWGRMGAIALIAIAVIYFLRDVGALPIPLPERRGQVPSWWRQFFGPAIASGLYGTVLGLGFATHLTYGTFVVVSAGALLTADPFLGAAICAPFGLLRGVVVVASATSLGRDLQKLEAAAVRRVARPVAAAASAGVAAVVTGSLIF